METRDRLCRTSPTLPLRAAQTVGVPARHEGVGLALRCAYVAPGDVPAALRDLLDRLP